MLSFTTDDGLDLKYLDTGVENERPDGRSLGADGRKKPWLILIHGFSGSHHAWKRNIPLLSSSYRVIAPDLRGHGESQMPKDLSVESVGVVRLAKDLRALIEVLAEGEGRSVEEWRGGVIGGSLGCAVVWAYAKLYGTTSFTHTIFVDQSPLQNQIPGDWDPPHCHKGLRTQSDFDAFAHTLMTDPTTAHLGTIHSCLGYISHPSLPATLAKIQETESYQEDREIFLTEALKCDSRFLVELMRDHTALDHRRNIKECFGSGSASQTRVLVVATDRSGCFDKEGPLSVVEFVKGDVVDGKELAVGEVVEWGGHWCYWEEPEKFVELVKRFLS